jgi:hypothetical protein
MDTAADPVAVSVCRSLQPACIPSIPLSEAAPFIAPILFIIFFQFVIGTLIGTYINLFTILAEARFSSPAEGLERHFRGYFPDPRGPSALSKQASKSFIFN